MGINIEEGKRVPSCTLTHVLKPCTIKCHREMQLIVRLLRARIHATRLGAEIVGGT
jgi:hypothetical protein